ncbi:hypothetical protein [Streptomyces violascens]|uniref:DUF4267 domain-containing protein n=1 Tax=Streptomyces violascens TaxID=67381 RepID=A0ABQ3QVU1_9ACTN|nr:hypothetical protein [Streptomyces violascens]GGU50774.1 hypothetical protein GCM10010289_84080 [Streptomyces violascens]GHI41390.1 hypothetical protein Sviol_57980 [Streptomyces violascens]
MPKKRASAAATSTARPAALYGLAGIRLLNGVAGLVAPALLIDRLDRASEPNPAAVYAFRLFGIRTILLGLDLLTNRGERLEQDLREGVLIHASDTLTAAMLGIKGLLPPRTAAMTTLISATNTALAVSALGNGAKGKK